MGLTFTSLIGCNSALLILSLLAAHASQAQGYAEGIGLSYERLPLQFKNDSAANFRANVFRANVIMPIPLGADSTQDLLVGTNLELLDFGGSRPGFGVGAVYSFSPIVGYRRRLSAKTELTALALPVLNSDLHDVRAADVTWGGVVRGIYRASPRLTYRLTLGYRQQFYGPQYVLLLGLDWQMGQRWRVFGDLPTTLTVSYSAAPKVNVGFNLAGINTAYRLQVQDRYLQYQQGHYGLFAEGYLSAHWALRATAAYALTRRIEVFAKDDKWPATLDYIGLGKAPTALSPAIEKGLAFRLALSYRVPTR